MDLSRRSLLLQSCLLWPVAEVLAAHEHAREASQQPDRAAFTHFSSAEAAEVEALIGQIIPAGDASGRNTPGAREAGVVYFIDRALATFEKDKQELYARGMADAQRVRQELLPRSKTLASLNAEQQIAVLKRIESTAFFELLRTHTVMGFLGNPEYDGNRGKAGWQCIGFEGVMSYQPPFGFYDRDEHRS
jgi:hypothetical protein